MEREKELETDFGNLTKQELIQGMVNWASVDSPWAHMVEPVVFKQSLNRILQLSPKMILSSHLPPAVGKTEEFLESLAALPTSRPFVAPGQAALEQMLAQAREVADNA